MKKIFFSSIFSILCLFFVFSNACAQDIQSIEGSDNSISNMSLTQGSGDLAKTETFEAEVVKILDQRKKIDNDGFVVEQQNLELLGLYGKWKEKKIIFEGISDVEVVDAGVYKVGDKVLVQRSVDDTGKEKYYVTDFVRRGYLYFLVTIFCLVILIIGKKKGFKSLLSLIISFFIIIKYVLPKILDGGNPLVAGLIGSFLILTVMIYLTEGWGRKSHLAITSVFISLAITLALSVIFTKLTKLSGLTQEEAVFLIGQSKQAINFQGLLLAGMLIGAVGVLDDVIVAQIEAVKQIKIINPYMSKIEVFKSAFIIGNTHLGTMVNTLFLTYAGASLPLLLLFVVHQEPFLSLSQVLNNEVIATEIVRTFTGSIGVALSMPIATFLGAYYLKVDKNKNLDEIPRS